MRRDWSGQATLRRMPSSRSSWKEWSRLDRSAPAETPPRPPGDVDRCEAVESHLAHGRGGESEGRVRVVGHRRVVKDVEEDVLGEADQRPLINGTQCRMTQSSSGSQVCEAPAGLRLSCPRAERTGRHARTRT